MVRFPDKIRHLTMRIDITALFVCLDDFCTLYENAIRARALPPTGIKTSHWLFESQRTAFHSSALSLQPVQRVQTFLSLWFMQSIAILLQHTAQLSIHCRTEKDLTRANDDAPSCLGSCLGWG